jgi:hypothetical protein
VNAQVLACHPLGSHYFFSLALGAGGGEAASATMPITAAATPAITNGERMALLNFARRFAASSASARRQRSDPALLQAGAVPCLNTSIHTGTISLRNSLPADRRPHHTLPSSPASASSGNSPAMEPLLPDDGFMLNLFPRLAPRHNPNHEPGQVRGPRLRTAEPQPCWE